MLICVCCDPLEVLVEPGSSVVVGLWAVWATRSVVQALWAAAGRPQGGTVHSHGCSHHIPTNTPVRTDTPAPVPTPKAVARIRPVELGASRSLALGEFIILLLADGGTVVMSSRCRKAEAMAECRSNCGYRLLTEPGLCPQCGDGHRLSKLFK